MLSKRGRYLIKNILKYAANYNDIFAVIDGTSQQRKETISYPGASLRESILNAFCHSNYFIRSNIKIEFYDDKGKITNPGGIYQATLEQIFDGVQTYRNPGLVNILSKLHYIENFGTGIPRILEAYENSTKKVDFSVSDNFLDADFIGLEKILGFNPLNVTVLMDGRLSKYIESQNHFMRVNSMNPSLLELLKSK